MTKTPSSDSEQEEKTSTQKPKKTIQKSTKKKAPSQNEDRLLVKKATKEFADLNRLLKGIDSEKLSSLEKACERISKMNPPEESPKKEEKKEKKEKKKKD